MAGFRYNIILLALFYNCNNTMCTTKRLRKVINMTNTTNLHNLPHMRGIKQAITELKQNDPETALTEKALRRLVLTGAIPSVKIGKKYLINMDILNNYLFSGSCDSEKVSAHNGIRQITE